ncbi:MAG TPA: glycosyltransferase family 1 protein [Anaerolineae bacterium]|nr:glycosyltransferase family 1 protein [Anaerolineae bacterium]
MHRYLMISPEYNLQRVGGLGVHVQGLAPRLSDRVLLDLFVPRYQGLGDYCEPLRRHGTVYRADAIEPRPGEDFDLQVWRMNDQINAAITRHINIGREFSLMHVHDWLSGYVANDLHQRYGIPMVATIHATEMGRRRGQIWGNPLSERIHLAEQYLIREADLIIVCSEFMRQEVITALNAPPEKIRVIPNGVEYEHLIHLRDQLEALPYIRRRWAEPDQPLIFFVGRLEWEKGPDLLVQAMPMVLEAFPNAKLILAGKGSYTDQLVALVRELELEAHVQVVGFISDQTRNEIYAVADVAVFPSRYEPFGIVALEAMAAGAPVIVGDVGGLSEVVEHGVTGLRTPNDPQAIADAILQTLHNPEQAAARARRAQDVVRTQYSWEAIAERVLEVYAELV